MIKLLEIKGYIGKNEVFSFFNLLLKFLSGPLTIIFLPLFITIELQGLWFSFASISALSVFADLGFSSIVTIFSAHEYSKVKKMKNRMFYELDNSIESLSSLFKFIILWVLKIALLSFPLIFFVGFFTFNSKVDIFIWFFPWLIFLFSSIVSFFVNVLFSFYEGLNQITSIQKIKFLSFLIYQSSLLILLSNSFNLYALAISSFLHSAILTILFFTFFKISIIQLLSFKNYEFMHWKKKFLSILFKYALSWVSGYFIFQVFVPLSFIFSGPILAGKIGFTMAIFTAAFTFSTIFYYTYNPKLNYFISNFQVNKARSLIKNLIFFSFILFIIIFLSITLTIFFLNSFFSIFDRLLSPFQIFTLFLFWLLQIPISGLALYLRAFKKEPLYLVSFFSGVFILLSSLLLFNLQNHDYIFIGLMLSGFIVLPFTIFIFNKPEFK
jgi:hypothetical protein